MVVYGPSGLQSPMILQEKQRNFYGHLEDNRFQKGSLQRTIIVLKSGARDLVSDSGSLEVP